MSEVVKRNGLQQQTSLIYQFPDSANQVFDYSDGKQVEKYLDEVLSNADDLSCRSKELQDKIIDWPSEYHLSSDRANLLRPYDLDGVSSALEFGSGCGAISRYLGELGIEVDAIEGSAIRAKLGKKRCRDLDNVNVINANYNELEIPQGHYDLVLFVGVIEYASKFHPEAKTDWQAAVGILSEAEKFLSPNGVIIVAIENRLGLKYILGHHEDHYSKRYVGIHNYKNSAGIATYSELEWREIMQQAGLPHCVFNYPFPDYKIPRISLHQQYVNSDDNAFNHLEGVFARDYTQPAAKGPTESIAWQAATAGKFLGTIANSFCIVMGKNQQLVDKVAPFDFCHMPGPGRKNQYAVLTRKLRNQDVVQKQLLFASNDTQAEQPLNVESVSQNLSDQAYLKGSLLSTEWLRSILIYSRRQEFEQQLLVYWQYLETIEEQGESLKIDLLPINIILTSDNQLKSFDQEWEVDWQISKEYLLFRALLTFAVTNWFHMKEFLGWLELYTVRDFIDYGFKHLNRILARYESEFVESENRFQALTTNNDDPRGVEQLLQTYFDFSSDNEKLYASLQWQENHPSAVNEKALEVEYATREVQQELEFFIEPGVKSLEALVFTPFDIRKTPSTGFFSISELRIIAIGEESEKNLLEIVGEADIAAASHSQNALFEVYQGGGFWLSTSDFPKLKFDFSQPLEVEQNARLSVRITIRASQSVEYILAHKQFLSKIRQADKYQSDIDELMRQKTSKLEIIEHDLRSAREEIAAIKSGKPFRFGMKVFSLISFLKR